MESGAWMSFATAGLRIDKWLWFTRLMKSRSSAAKLCESRHVRLDGRVIDRAHALVRVGQVISFQKAGQILAVRVLYLPDRRGPAATAQSQYEILSQSQLQPAPENRYDPSRQQQPSESGA
jgi:ribosome-associated heat shock protein Hsp15